MSFIKDEYLTLNYTMLVIIRFLFKTAAQRVLTVLRILCIITVYIQVVLNVKEVKEIVPSSIALMVTV